jgi:hypothetical protein
MANKKLAPELRQDFTDRLNAIYNEIPPSYKDTIKVKHPELKISTIENVRYGKTINTTILKMLEDIVDERRKKRAQQTQ